MTEKELIMKIELSDELKNRIEEVEHEHIKEVQKLRQDNETMQRALEYYAATWGTWSGNPRTPVTIDDSDVEEIGVGACLMPFGGRRAREAIAKIAKGKE